MEIALKNSNKELIYTKHDNWTHLPGHFPPPCIIPGKSLASRPGPDKRFTP